jgi:hypothetical protein
MVYNPPGGDTHDSAQIDREIVVIKNTTSTVRKLAGWTLRDLDHHVYKFPRTRLGPGHSVTVHTGVGSDSPVQRYWGRDWYVWDNSGDAARLRNRAGILVDSCKWSSGHSTATC